ncbi:MAG: flagellar protein FlaG [Succinivibrio sp.]|nr:flagellar protein FlaG [Succinivibrio sp.]
MSEISIARTESIDRSQVMQNAVVANQDPFIRDEVAKVAKNDVAYSDKVSVSEEGAMLSGQTGTQSLNDDMQTRNLVEQRKNELEKKREEEAAEEAQEENRELMMKLNSQNLGLSFSIDEDVNMTVISVMDRNTDDLVRKIPSEDFLRMAKTLQEAEEAAKNRGGSVIDKDALKGLIFDEKA